MNFSNRIKIVSAVLCAAIIMTLMPMVANAAEVVEISASCAEYVSVGGEISVRITVGKPTVPLAGLEFAILFNSDFVSPKITDNSLSQMDSFVEHSPSGWEQMCGFSQDESKYYLRFACPEGGSAYLTEAGQLSLVIPFTVTAAGTFSFIVSSSETVAVAADENLTVHSGKGSEAYAVSSGEKEKIGVLLSGAEQAFAGGQYELTAKVTNLGDASGIISAEFELAYDTASLAPVITENDALQMDAFMQDMPNGDWEQMCSLDAERGIYTLRFAARYAGSNAEEMLAESAFFRVVIPFEVIASEGAVMRVEVPSKSVLGVNGSTAVLFGRGDDFSASVVKGEGIVIPPESGYTKDGEVLTGVSEKTPISQFLAAFEGLYVTDRSGAVVTEGFVCTGYRLTDGETSVSIAVRGDANGNGTVDVIDYSIAKRVFLETYLPDEAIIKALALVNGTEVTVTDYIEIKRHVLGTFDINE